MTSRPMRQCRKCGASFESSPTDSTVNCPACRESARTRQTEPDVNAGYVDRANARYAMGHNDAIAGRQPIVTSNTSYRQGYAAGLAAKGDR